MSLFNQSVYWYQCLATMRQEWFDQLMTAYERILHEHRFLAEILKCDAPQEREK